jgi:hypothetical protein
MTISTEQFLSVNTGVSANDGTGDSLRNAFIKVNQNFDNMSTIGFNAGNINCQGSISIFGNTVINNSYVPGANTATGTAGQVSWDGDYVYICVAANSWKRANLASW